MAQLDKTFPTMDCSICILAPKMVECYRHPNVRLLTYSEVMGVEGAAGDFTVKVLRKPKYVEEEKCVGCGVCAEHCPVEVPNEFDEGLIFRKAIYTPFPQAVPRVYVIDRENCLECKLCEKTCAANAVNLEQESKVEEIRVGAIIAAVGFDVFNPSILSSYGYGRHQNVITALQLERLLSASGPTAGRLMRLSDGKIPKSVAFIQCVGSRDRRFGYPHCSSICCKYSVKDAVLIKEHRPETDVYVLYIDLRVFGKGFQEFANRAKNEFGVKFIRSSPGEITENPETKDLTVWYEDTITRTTQGLTVDLVVLCSALTPRTDSVSLAKLLGIGMDEFGFFKASHDITSPVDTQVPGIFACGYCIGPRTGDIPDSVTQASAAAARVAEILGSTGGGS
ncbi:MAG: FAD-dependent oxidoreductase [Candidatus Bathyarchaeia archaeon]